MASLAISKRRSKKLAAGVIIYLEEQGWWALALYGIVNEKVAPFGMSMFESLDAARLEGNETLKTADADWVEVDEESIDTTILAHATNRWTVPDRTRRD